MPAARFLTGASRSALNTPDISTSVAHPQTAGREGGRPPFLRGRVWLYRRALDTKLAKGMLPSSSAQLSYRAEQLRSSRCRGSFAAGIKRIIEAAEEPPSSFTSAVPVRRREILDARAELTDLARLLQSGASLQVRGLALLEPLLTSGDSPLFHPNAEETLDRTVRRIRAALLLR
jgi:hypothetical protein